MQHLVTKGLTATAKLWPDVQAEYAWVHRAAHILANPEQDTAQDVQRRYQSLLDKMRQETSASEPLQKMITIFLKVTDSYWAGLFSCYEVADLPRTNNDLEHTFGSVRYHERRATGRKQASPGLVTRGAVRMVASVASQRYLFSGPDLEPCDLRLWRTLRHQVESRKASAPPAISFQEGAC